jgi:Caspase domain
MGVFRTIVFVVIATWLGCSSALAEKRVALVIGNSAYKNVPRLANPVNDATIVAAMLNNAGFDLVTTKLDVNIVEMRKALREFGVQTRNADVAVIFYAGHGVELDGNNYLIPTDAVLETDTDVFDETFPLDRVLFTVEPAKQLRLIILDACRDNPFAKTMKRTIAARAVGRGLARVEPNSPNSMIAFAAKAGSTASDGGTKNSPFAVALVEHLPKPGLDLRKAFGFVRDDVLKNTGYKQEPYVYGSLGGGDVPLVPAKPTLAGPQPNPQDAIRRDYELALHLGTREGWNAFLAQYPDGFYASLARGELNKIAAEEARAAAAEKARLAEQEKARLAAEGAKKAEQEKAAAAAKAAEEARVAAEKAKQLAQAKAEAAEQARIVAENSLAERIAAEKKKAEEEAKAAEAERGGIEKDRVARERAEQEKMRAETAAKQKMTELTPPQQTLVAPAPSRLLAGAALVEEIKKELKRVGCYAGPVDDNWTTAQTGTSIKKFVKAAHASASPDQPTTDLLDALRGRSDRVCPLECGAREVEAGGQCVAKRCATGYARDQDGDCVKQKDRRKDAARSRKAAPSTNNEPAASPPSRTRGSAVVDNTGFGPGKVTQSGVTTCGRRGCQFVPKNCHAVAGAGGHGLGGRIFCP